MMRRLPLFLLLLALVFAIHSEGDTRPLIVGDLKQLFIDHKFIDKAQNITLTLNPPLKEGVVLKGESPWENGLLTYGSVVDDGGFYKMWYNCLAEGRNGVAGIGHTCYATSRDGISWVKPILGLVDFDGTSANNIVSAPENFDGEGTSVFLDPIASPDQRFKRVALPYGPDLERGGLYIEYSSDGLTWTMSKGPVFPFFCDTDNQAFYDPRIQKYVAYVRILNPWRKVGRIEMDNILSPWPYEKSSNLNLFAGPKRLPSVTDQIPTVLSYDKFDPEVTDIYNPGVEYYPWAQDAYFAFPSVYRHFPQAGGGRTFDDYKKYKGPNPDGQGRYINDGVLDIEMAVSRDGIHWDRMDRRPYIGLGTEGSPDSRIEFILVGWIRRGGEIYQYYLGKNYSHGQLISLKRVRNLGAILRVVQRLDGFVSVDTDYHGGSLTTPSVIFQGHHLELNLKTASTGEVCVEMEDEEGKPIEGYAKEDCDEVVGNYVAKTITWRGNQECTKLAGKPVRLHILMRNAKLYAFQFKQ